jgi:HEPN domain-containing protein
MSRSEDRAEAQRWLDTAAEDFEAARSLAAAGHHAHACFSAQQCAEKAVKAAWYLIGTPPWGHSVQKLVNDFPKKDQFPDLDALIEKTIILDRLYVPTRYPNGLPDLTPEKSYFAADSQHAIGLARDVLAVFRQWVETWK